MKNEKVVIMSIRAKHLYNICTYQKSIEVRKKAPKNYVGWVYLYCSLGGERKSTIVSGKLNGYIMYRFWYDFAKVEETYFGNFPFSSGYENEDGIWVDTTEEVEDTYLITSGQLEQTCLTAEELEKYGQEKPLSLIPIQYLQRLPKVLSLSYFGLKRPPQNYCYVEMEQDDE